MKGQYLHVRATRPADTEAIERFYATEGRVVPELDSREGFVAKLAGGVVAHAIGVRKHDELAIVFLYVGEPFRSKRVGRRFLDEIVRIAAEQGAERLHVDSTCQLGDFFSSMGFATTQNGLERVVRSKGART